MREVDGGLIIVENALTQQGENAAADGILCDTAQELIHAADPKSWKIVKFEGGSTVGAVYVKRRLEKSRQFRGVGKKIIVPKTIAVSNMDRSKLALLTYLTHEFYDQVGTGPQDGDFNHLGANHEGIDTWQVMGRRRGECSPVIAKSFLTNFSEVHMSNGLYAVLSRNTRAVAYPLGWNKYLLMKGKAFLAGYRDVLQNAGVKSNL